jgi:uncharacterized membrane protein
MSSQPQWKTKTEPESRRPVFIAAVMVIAGQAWVARSLGVRPFWVIPLVSAVLLATSITVYERRRGPGHATRVIMQTLNGVLIVGSVISLALLVRGVFAGSTLTAPYLMLAGIALWVVDLGVFALVYWEMDAGGPEARAEGYVLRWPDLVFPQLQTDQEALTPPVWKPTIYDYLYVSLTSSLAFSPTDAMPYTRRAKLVMGAENLLSFATLAVIVARAVNIAR